MSDAEVIVALAEHWAVTVPYLSQEDTATLREALLAIQLEPGDERAAKAALADVKAVLAARLPRGHPVRNAMPDGKRYQRQPQQPAGLGDLGRIAEVLGSIPDLRQPPVPGGQVTGAVGTGAAGESADAWLLAVQALTEQEVRANGCDPARDDLIRLPAAERGTRLPAFQFGPDGQPLPVVTEVNRLLDAAGDPWGVADWWLGLNAWLGDVPAGLLGRVADAQLVLAARAELPDE